MKNHRKHLWVAAALAVVGAASVPGRVDAQYPAGLASVCIVQDGQVVGQLYRDDPNTAKYVEHWVLYPGYIYPSTQNNVVTQMVPGCSTYPNSAAFLKNVPFTAGSRYVKVTAEDGTKIPGR